MMITSDRDPSTVDIEPNSCMLYVVSDFLAREGGGPDGTVMKYILHKMERVSAASNIYR